MLREQLLEQERQYWFDAGQGDHYERNFLDEGVLVFPAPVGIIDKRGAIDAVSGSLAWTRVDFDDVEVVELSDTVALLAYHARGERDGAEGAYEAYITSVYVHRDGDWRLAAHQQSPGTV